MLSALDKQNAIFAHHERSSADTAQLPPALVYSAIAQYGTLGGGGPRLSLLGSVGIARVESRLSRVPRITTPRWMRERDYVVTRMIVTSASFSLLPRDNKVSFGPIHLSRDVI